MSRYRIESLYPDHCVYVGWDGPLSTFFGQVEDAFDPESTIDIGYGEGIIYWVGAFPTEITTVNKLAEMMTDYAQLSPQTISALEHDQATSAPPTPLQQWARQLITDTLGDEACP